MKKLIFILCCVFCLCSCTTTYQTTVECNYDVAYFDTTITYNKSCDYTFNVRDDWQIPEDYVYGPWHKKSPNNKNNEIRITKFTERYFDIITYSNNGSNYIALKNKYCDSKFVLYSTTAHIRLNSYKFINIHKYK